MLLRLQTLKLSNSKDSICFTTFFLQYFKVISYYQNNSTFKWTHCGHQFYFAQIIRCYISNYEKFYAPIYMYCSTVYAQNIRYTQQIISSTARDSINFMYLLHQIYDFEPSKSHMELCVQQCRYHLVLVNNGIIKQKGNVYRTPSKEGQLKCILPLKVITQRGQKQRRLMLDSLQRLTCQ